MAGATVRLEDPTTLEAVRILADVLEEMAGPERLECLMAANALRQVLETRSNPALDFARQAFDALTGEVRGEVSRRAHSAANQLMASRRSRPANGRAASPFLGAVNMGGRA